MLRISETLAIATRYYEQKHFARSAEICREILQQQPENLEALHLLSTVADRLGDIETVILCYQKLIGHLPDRLDVYCKLGSTLRASRRFQEAIAIYQKAIALKPDCYQAHNNLGNVFRDRKELEEAIACFQRALAINPNYTDAHLNLGAVLIEQDKLDEAIAVLQELLTLHPESVDVYCNLGAALAYRDKLEEAMACYQTAIALQPDCAEAYASLGRAFGQQCKSEEEIACYQKAIELKPDLAPARFNLATALLRSGDFKRGFVEYEWRWQIQKTPPPFPSHLLWDGSDLQGRTILIWTEQGFGDTLQFIRYVPLVAGLGGKIVLQCSSSVIRLMSVIDGISNLVALDSTPPEFDVYLPLLSLPRILGTTLETIPAQVPYLFSSHRSAVSGYQSLTKDEGQKTEDETFKVGIVWASGYRESSPEYRQTYRQKSCPVDLFVELLAFPNVSLYSLQVGRDAGDIAKFGSKPRLQALSDRICDFADTATAIARLNLVISVDTAVAHLAGAMGKPVWVLLPFSPDWRWMLGREDSPWYPTMRLFRQSQDGNWAGVFEQVIEALREHPACSCCAGS